jgi:hypothetical protein
MAALFPQHVFYALNKTLTFKNGVYVAFETGLQHCCNKTNEIDGACSKGR